MTDDRPLPGPGRIADTSTYDGAVSQLISPADGEILLFYHTTSGRHVGPDGRVVVRRSTNYGDSWSEPRPVIEEPEIDPSSFSVVHHPASGRIVVFAVAYAFPDYPRFESFPDREYVATHRVTSTDGGSTWSEPTSMDKLLSIDTPKPFGGSVQSSRGLATAFQSEDHELEVLFSADGGRTWGERVFVASSDSGHQLSEPVPCAVTPEKILLFGRDNETGGFYAIRSPDGGIQWDDPAYFSPTGSGPPNPIWVKRTGPNELTAIWGDRKDRCIYQACISAQLAWQDPTALSDAPRKRLAEQIGDAGSASYWGGDAGDFGYPTFVQVGPRRSECLSAWYDGGRRPNLWQMALY